MIAMGHHSREKLGFKATPIIRKNVNLSWCIQFHLGVLSLIYIHKIHSSYSKPRRYPALEEVLHKKLGGFNGQRTTVMNTRKQNYKSVEFRNLIEKQLTFRHCINNIVSATTYNNSNGSSPPRPPSFAQLNHNADLRNVNLLVPIN